MTPDYQLQLAVWQLTEALEGATVLNVYLLHKLGGQLVINQDELTKVCNEFSRTAWGTDGQGQIVIRLYSTPERKAAQYGN